MRIGIYFEGAADEAFLRGLHNRWCPNADLVVGRRRGTSKKSLRRELKQYLTGLRDRDQCDLLVCLTDCDSHGKGWRDIKKNETAKVPQDCKHLTVYGVADRNLECWMALDGQALAAFLGCAEGELPRDDVSGFVKRRLEIETRDKRDEAKERIRAFVKVAPLKTWIIRSDSFAAFYQDLRAFALQQSCDFPNERD